MIKYAIATTLVLVIVGIGCGHHSGGSDTDANGGGDDGGGSGSGSGSGSGHADARIPPGCENGPIPGNPQCSNCIDDDGDGFIDGNDIECTGPADNDESSFATGIPGDNVDGTKQDCFFDGNSGSGDDGCEIHVCCLLGAPDQAHCPFHPQQYDPAACPPPIGTAMLAPKCLTTCAPLAPAGCDCFACCTVCDPATGICRDIEENSNVSPDCTSATLGDPTKCLPCQKVTSCGGGGCGGDTCTLCPGQDPSTLPASCNGTNTCPNGEMTCTGTDTCGASGYCSSGCCIGIIQ